jgi:hypothetical protein
MYIYCIYIVYIYTHTHTHTIYRFAHEVNLRVRTPVVQKRILPVVEGNLESCLKEEDTCHMRRRIHVI